MTLASPSDSQPECEGQGARSPLSIMALLSRTPRVFGRWHGYGAKIFRRGPLWRGRQRLHLHFCRPRRARIVPPIFADDLTSRPASFGSATNQWRWQCPAGYLERGGFGP